MATVIDALIVTLGLDAKQYKQGQKEVVKGLDSTRDQARKTAADMERSGKQAAQFFSKVRNEALAMLAVFTAGVGIKNFVANTVTGAASLGRLSQNLNMSTADLRAWQKAAERAGGTAEGIVGQLQESARSVGEFRLGQANATTQAFFRFGGSVDDLRDGNTFLLARARIVSDLYKTDKERAAVVAQQLGIDQATFDLIKQGPAAIQRLVAEQRKRATVTEADAKAADKLRIQFLDMRDSLEKTAMRVTITLFPVFERMLSYFERLGQWFDEHGEDVEKWVTNAVDGIVRFAKAADEAAKSVGGWQNVLIALVGLKLLGTVASLVRLAGALGGVGKGLATIAAASGALKVLGPLGMLVYSRGLNAGEDEELARRRAMGPTIDNPELPQRGNAREAVDALVKMGWTREQAIGIAANLQQESNFDPEAIGDNGKAYGLAQWDPDRQAMFKKVMGKDIVGSSFREQLQFLDWELRNTEARAGKRLKMETTAAGAAASVSKNYERPANEQLEMERRRKLAENIVRTLGGAGAASVPGNMAAANAARAGYTSNVTTSGDTNNTTRIDNITINTQATDAAGIARDIRREVGMYNDASLANTGVN